MFPGDGLCAERAVYPCASLLAPLTRSAVLMSLPLFCLADDEHNATELRGETCSRLSHADASDSPTDCPAQHGGAKRQPLTDVAALPKRGIATRYRERPPETPHCFANAPAFDMSVMTIDERRD